MLTMKHKEWEWSASAVFDADGLDGVDIEALAQWMVKRWHEIARENGSEAVWSPLAEEVVAPEDESFDYEAWLQQVKDESTEKLSEGAFDLD